MPLDPLVLQPDVDPEPEAGRPLLRQPRPQRQLLVLEVTLLPGEADQQLQPGGPGLPGLPLLPRITVLLAAVNAVGPTTINI